VPIVYIILGSFCRTFRRIMCFKLSFILPFSIYAWVLLFDDVCRNLDHL